MQVDQVKLEQHEIASDGFNFIFEKVKGKVNAKILTAGKKCSAP